MLGIMNDYGMMWGGHTGGLWLFGFGLYAIFRIAGIIIFFWLMFRITWALEAIARSKREGTSTET